FVFFFSSRRRHTRFSRDWSSDVCSSDLRVDYRSQSKVAEEDLLGKGVRKSERTGEASIVREGVEYPVAGPPSGEFNRKQEEDIRSEERRVGKECRTRW